MNAIRYFAPHEIDLPPRAHPTILAARRHGMQCRGRFSDTPITIRSHPSHIGQYIDRRTSKLRIRLFS